MTSQKFPPGWDENRVRRLIDECESLSENEQVAADEAVAESSSGQAVIAVPTDLLPEIRRLLGGQASPS